MPRSSSIRNTAERSVTSPIKKGRFDLASRLVSTDQSEEKNLKLDSLRGAIIEGETSGKAMPFRMEDFLKTKRKAGLDST